MRSDGSVAQVLLIHDPYGNWALPKGHIERGEDAASAALREVREETGLEHVELGVELGSMDWYFRRDDLLVHKVCSFFLMRFAGGELSPEVAEGITECEWLPAPEAIARVTYENAREMIRVAVQRFHSFLPEGGDCAEGSV